MDVAEAIRQLEDGKDQWVDTASVNDQLFLNSFNLGLYPHLAALREKRRAAHAHWPKAVRWLVDSFASAVIVLANWRRLHFVLEIDGECLVGKTVTFAVTNNEKSIPPGPSPLDRGELVAYIPKPVSRLGTISLFLRGVFSTHESLEPLRVIRAEKIAVHVVDGTPMTIDGESGKVDGDLVLRILPRHLRVRAPAGSVQK
jgi:diacylglycerol kinase family enzyme